MKLGTRSDVERKLLRINRMLSPVPLAADEAQPQSQQRYGLDSAYGGWRMTENAGGKDVLSTGYVTMRDLYQAICSFETGLIVGLERGRLEGLLEGRKEGFAAGASGGTAG